MQNTISTNRLSLDILTEGDAGFIIEIVNSKGWLQFIGDRNVHSKEDAIVYIHKILATPNLYYWVVRIKEESIPIGIVSFIKRTYLDNFDIGFALLPGFAGKGYAYEAANGVLSIVKTDPVYKTILATTIPSNLSSIKLLGRLGLHFEKEIEVGNEKLHIYTNQCQPKL